MSEFPERVLRKIQEAHEKQLTALDLSSNQLTNLPESITKLPNLTDLNLSYNQLTNLPESITKLPNLTGLDLSSNQLTNLPESIGTLAHLTDLDLSSNQLKELPESVTKFRNLIWLDFNDNPLVIPPLEIATRGMYFIKEYFQQLKQQGEDYIYEAKLLIVGEGGAGKTTLAYKIQDNNCPLPDIDDRTKGITINTHPFSIPAHKNQEDRRFKLNVWDFGGQEIYHATHRFFLSQRSLYVLVADNRKDDTDFNYWLNIIELFAGNSPIIIVLNEKTICSEKLILLN